MMKQTEVEQVVKVFFSYSRIVKVLKRIYFQLTTALHKVFSQSTQRFLCEALCICSVFFVFKMFIKIYNVQVCDPRNDATSTAAHYKKLFTQSQHQHIM